MKLCFYCDKELIPDKDAQAKNYAECMHCNTGHHLDCFMTHAQCSDCGCGDARFSPAVVAQVSSIDAFVAAYEQKLQDPRFTQAQPGVITELVCAEMHVEPTPQYYGVGEKLNHLEKTHVPRKGAYAVATAAGVGGFAGLGAGHIVGAILSLFGLGIVGYHVVLYSAIGTGTYAGGKTAHFFWKGRQKKYQQERQLLLGGGMRNVTDKKCTYCSDTLDKKPAAPCTVCEAPYHVECFVENGKCARYGCTGDGLRFSTALAVSRTIDTFIAAYTAKQGKYSNTPKDVLCDLVCTELGIDGDKKKMLTQAHQELISLDKKYEPGTSDTIVRDVTCASMGTAMVLEVINHSLGMGLSSSTYLAVLFLSTYLGVHIPQRQKTAALTMAQYRKEKEDILTKYRYLLQE